MQTFRELNEGANLAHLDVTEANIMLTPNTKKEWYTLKLFDFGLSQPFMPGEKGHARPYCDGSCLPCLNNGSSSNFDQQALVAHCQQLSAAKHWQASDHCQCMQARAATELNFLV